MPPKLGPPKDPRARLGRVSDSRKADFGKRVEGRIRRLGLNYTQVADKLAERLGRDYVSDDSVRNWAHGVNIPRGPTLRALATELDVTPEDLLGDAAPEEDRPKNELFEQVLLACNLREKARGRTFNIARTDGPPPFHEIAEIRFSEPFGACGVYALAAVSGELAAPAVSALRDEIASRPHIHWASLIYSGALAPEDVVTLGGPIIRVASLVEFEELIDFRPYLQSQTQRLATDSLYRSKRYVPQRVKWSVGADQERDADSAFDLLRSWVSLPGPLFGLVLGDFGTGKTFLLHELAQHLARDGGPLTPVLIKMQALEKARTLDALVAQHLALTGMDRIDLEAFRYMLREGRLVLLFDGYDELALRVTFDRAAEHLGTLLQAAIGNAKVVLTSRTQHFYSDHQVKTALLNLIDKTGGFRLARLQHFSEQQIHTFLVKHLEDQGAADARLRLLDEVKDLLGLSAIPRMLGFIADLPESELREARDKDGTVTAAALYQRLLDWWFKKEDNRVHRPGAPPALKAEDRWAAVDALATRLWVTTERAVSYRELPATAASAIQGLRARQINEEEAGAAIGSATLLVRDAEGNFSFLHQSVMEWLVARSAAREVAVTGHSEALGVREISPLMADFFWALTGKEAAVAWARGVLGPDVPTGDATRKNALLVLGRLDVPVQRGVNLAGQDLRGQDLSGRDLREADLFGADLRLATLVGADLTGARLCGANLVGADLSRAILEKADLTGADLSHARLLGASLRGAKLAKVRLRYARLPGAILDDGALTGLDVFGAAPPQPTHASATMPGASPCNAVAWSADGALLASAHRSGVVCLWETATGEMLRTLQGHSSSVRSVAFSPDGTTLASGSSDNTLGLWDVVTGARRHTLKGHSSSVLSVAFSPDGATLASGSDDNTLGLWDVATGARRYTLKGHSSSVVWSVAFSPDGTTLVTGSADNTLGLWDVATGAHRHTLQGHSSVLSVAFSPDGTTLASGSYDNTLGLWDVATGARRHTLQGHSSSVLSVAFSPDGTMLASGSSDNTLGLWDVATGARRYTLKGHSDSVLSVAFSPDGTMVASGSDDNTLGLWDVATGARRHTAQVHSDSVRSVAFSPDGTTLASGSYDNTLGLWDVATGARRHILQGHSSSVRSVAFSPDGTTLASGSSDNTLGLWNVATGARRHILKGHSDSVWSVAFSPDGTTLASGSSDNTLGLWDVATGARRHTLKGHSDSVLSVAFSPDGTMLASGSYDNTLGLWDVATGARRHILKGHSDSVWSVAFSPDGATLASGSDDNTLGLWDVATGAHRHTLQGHSSYVLSVAFSPDGTTLATGSSDNTLGLWDVATGARRHIFKGHSSSVLSVAFSPDGTMLASGSYDNTLGLWDVATGICLAVLVPASYGWAAFTPGGRYRLSGDIGGAFWFVANLCRFEPGELDGYVTGIQRLSDNEPLLLPCGSPS